tara:strand:+ start:17790 stop:18266 length:477 start_codon:yes stop_codon:yes gene_type:complete
MDKLEKFLNEGKKDKKIEKELDSLFKEYQDELEKLDEAVGTIAVGLMITMMLGVITAGAIDTTDEGDDLKRWFSDKIVPKIKKVLGVDKKAKAILDKIRKNPEAMEDIKNAKRGTFRATVNKYLSKDEFNYLWDVTHNNIDTGNLSNAQIKKRNFKGE